MKQCLLMRAWLEGILCRWFPKELSGHEIDNRVGVVLDEAPPSQLFYSAACVLDLGYMLSLGLKNNI